MSHTFLITPGEFKSIGLEVCLKALKKINTTNDSYVFFSREGHLKQHSKFIDFKIKEIHHLDEAKPGISYINSTKTPVDWFKEACEVCSSQTDTHALVTGPLVKSSFKDSKILGHTEYLRSQYPKKDLFMTFFGEHYNCLLLNDHVPLNDVHKHISKDKIQNALLEINSYMPRAKAALLGLNPHAGEDGLIGSEELEIHNTISTNFDLTGPLPADGFFNLDSYKRFDFLIANYHDQGLIPFKLINGFKASQATLGLPFVRTSVDHGTSESLFLTGQANPSSMEHALKLAKELLNKRGEK